MITKAEQAYILNWLKLVEVKQQEVHDEFYDHIVTSFEEAREKNVALNIKFYLREIILPDFGGTQGIKRIVKRQTQEVNKYFRKRLTTNFKSYFTWPMILVVASLFLLLKMSFDLFEIRPVLIVVLVLAVLVPMLTVLAGQLSFYLNCKKHKMNYSSSIKNNALIIHAALLSCLAQFPNWIKIVMGRDYELVSSPLLILGLSIGLTLILIFSLSYIKLIKEHFDFKLSFT